MTNAEKVKEFMEAFGQEVKESPELADHKTACLRLKLILEEFEELEDAQAEGHLVGIADALSDLLYVVYGTAHTFGIPIDKCFEEVHNSNMSKRSVDGNPIFRDDGKVLKGPNFYEPNLKGILNE